MFTKLHLSQACQQIMLEEDCKQYVMVNSPRLFKYNQLLFGMSSAPAIFQRIMGGLIQGIPRVAVYLDDILITGPTESEHLQNLAEEQNRLKETGLHRKRSKCSFLAYKVISLGCKVDAQGHHQVRDKVKAIRDALAPRNSSELKAY